MQLPTQVKDITGQTFGRLFVVEFTRTVRTASGSGATAYWKCQCSCGNGVEVAGSSLRSGNTKSCGCLERELTVQRNFRHGGAPRGMKRREYIVYRNMLSRCYDPKHEHYDRYGGRGIGVCDRWLVGEGGKHGFTCFLEDMGPKPSPRHSIDRIENDSGYRPGNCRWELQRAQVRNSTKATLIDTPLGQMSIKEAAERYGVDYGMLRSRLRYGWEPVRALTEPSKPAETILVNGVEMTFGDAAQLGGITVGGIKKRLRQGWSSTDAVLVGRQKTGPKA